MGAIWASRQDKTEMPMIRVLGSNRACVRQQAVHGQQAFQFACGVKFADHVTAADKLPFDVELWRSGPVCIFFDGFVQFAVIKDIDVTKRHIQLRQDLDDCR